MNRISCDVMKDLLPSYIDGICSRDTVVLVEEHMADCIECQRLAERMKNVEIDITEDNTEAASYLKKLKRHIQNKNLFSFVMLFLILAAELAMVFYGKGSVSVYWYYAAVPLLAGAAYMLLWNCTGKSTAAKWKLGLGIAEGIGLVYLGLLENWVIHTMQTGEYPAGISTDMLGPLVYYQLMGIALLCAGVFLGTIYMSIRTENRENILLIVSITGGCAALTFASLLKRLNDIQSFIKVRNRELGILLLEGTILLMIFWMVERRKKS